MKGTIKKIWRIPALMKTNGFFSYQQPYYNRCAEDEIVFESDDDWKDVLPKNVSEQDLFNENFNFIAIIVKLPKNFVMMDNDEIEVVIKRNISVDE